MTNPVSQKDQNKGNEGEAALEAWLKRQRFSYLALCQDAKHFAPAFAGDIKRPDFLVLLESVGMIAVDAKNRKLYTSLKPYPGENILTLPYGDEFRKTVTFERVFRLPVWYAFKTEKKDTWYWISALKVIEVGEPQKNDEGEYLAIRLGEFEEVKTRMDFGKLYQHKMPKYHNLRNSILDHTNLS